MLRPQFFIETLKDNGIDFFAGVPDSLLKNICAYMTDTLPREQNIIAANEGGAIGIAAGYHLATGRIACVYMQNSGEGNIINPLASLTDKEVYNIPVLLLIGWRGKPGEHDEPQHIKQGKITTGLLNTLGVDYTVLNKDENKAKAQIEHAVRHMTRTNEVYALVIEKDTFEAYALESTKESPLTLSREEAIKTVASHMGDKDVAVSTTGMISRELFEHRTSMGESHERDFLTVGSMGHTSQIALGIALEKKDRKIWCFDGDGATIMHMGNMAITASLAPRNYIHVVFNNGAHDSVGGQPTVGLDMDLCAAARSVGYMQTFSVRTAEELLAALDKVTTAEGPVLLQVCVRKGNRKDLGRPTTTPIQNKEALMAFLNR